MSNVKLTATFTLEVNGVEHDMGTLTLQSTTLKEVIAEVEAIKAKTGMTRCLTTFGRKVYKAVQE